MDHLFNSSFFQSYVSPFLLLSLLFTEIMIYLKDESISKLSDMIHVILYVIELATLNVICETTLFLEHWQEASVTV
jgi:predicted house-cleaning noncanonical NTP pyrophosphatase (MazG superfamily)